MILLPRPFLLLLVAVVAALAGLASVSVSGGGGLAAAKTRVPQTQGELILSFAPVARKAMPAVVNVYARKVVRVRRRVPLLFDDPFFRRFFGDEFLFGRPMERVRNSLGSGVIVTPDGYVVTNNHVIADADDIRVVLADRREFPARVVARDERTDLAFLKISAEEPLPYLKIGDSDALEVGDIVLAIGNPFGVGQTVTQGIVSATARTGVGRNSYQFFIQTDAAINPGNSGGALVNMKGELVGINTMIFSRSGGSNGIGFAIPSNLVRTLLNSIRSEGRIVRPWAGVVLQAVTPDIAESLGLKRPAGALVVRFHPLSPLRKAGLKRGDVIIAVDGHAIGDVREFGYRFGAGRVGSPVRITFMRGERRRTVTARRVAPPEVPPRDETVIRGRVLFSGLKVANLSPAVIAELGLSTPLKKGVAVIAVLGGPAARAGFRRGDVILEVNGVKVDSVRTLRRLLGRGERIWEVAIERKGRILQLRR
jgi:Do/DeqQ family serine protease